MSGGGEGSRARKEEEMLIPRVTRKKSHFGKRNFHTASQPFHGRDQSIKVRYLDL
jgi:hypothetical protein